MKERLQQYALLAEIISAAVIVISLFFVGLQVRDGNRETRAATVQATINAEMVFQTQILLYAGVWEKISNGEPLQAGEEMRRGIALYNMMMTLNEIRFEQFNAGYLDTGPSAALRELARLPMADLWRNSPGAFSRSPEFLDLIDSLRSETSSQ